MTLWKSKYRSHKRDGIGVRRITTFPFSSDSAYDSVAYDLVKTRLLESEVKAEGEFNHCAMQVPPLYDWSGSSVYLQPGFT